MFQVKHIWNDCQGLPQFMNTCASETDISKNIFFMLIMSYKKISKNITMICIIQSLRMTWESKY